MGDAPSLGSSTPNVGLIMNPDGTIEYRFDGHLIARGLDLVAGTSQTPTDDRKIRWLDDGASVREDYAALYLPEALFGRTKVTDPDNPDDQYMTVTQAVDHFIGFSLMYAQAAYDGDSASARIIDSQGRSSFMQLAGTPREIKTNLGTEFIFFDDSQEEGVAVAHGLGEEPTHVQVTCDHPRILPYCTTRTATHLWIAGWRIDGNHDGDVQFDWTASIA